MKYTLLDLVQIIASSLDSDEVNSVNDSVESQQIATVVRTAYYDILERNNLPEHFDLINLQSGADTTQPVILYVPTNISKVYWLKYNIADTENPDLNMRDVTFLSLEDFLAHTHRFSESEDEVHQLDMTINGSVIPFLYRDDQFPQYYTSFDDKTLVFDSYNSDEESYLTGSRSLAAAKNIVPFTMSDDFVPDLDESQFTLLLNEAKSLAWIELRQTPHAKAEQNARRAWINTQKSKVRVPGVSDFDKLVNFGRR